MSADILTCTTQFVIALHFELPHQKQGITLVPLPLTLC